MKFSDFICREAIRTNLEAAGRADEPFEMILAVKARLDADLCKRFEDLGVTSFMCAPSMFAKDRSLQGRTDAVRRYADDVIAKVR